MANLAAGPGTAAATRIDAWPQPAPHLYFTGDDEADRFLARPLALLVGFSTSR